MMKPTIHLNGTSREELRSVNMRALAQLRRAQDALAAAAPNPRDFYVQGDDASLTAAKEHAARYAAIGKIIREIEEIAEHVS